MYVFGECNNRCIRYIDPYFTCDIKTIDFIDINIGESYFYCIQITTLNYDDIYTPFIIKEFDLLQSIEKVNFNNFEVKDNLILYNIDTSLTRNLIKYDFFMNLHYDRRFLVTYNNCELIEKDKIKIINDNKPFKITTNNPIVVSTDSYFEAKTTMLNSGHARFYHKYIISNFEIIITIDKKQVLLKITSFNNGKEYLIYQNKIADIVPSYTSRYTLRTKHDVQNKKFEIEVFHNDSSEYFFSENICPISLSSIINQFEIGSDLYEENTFEALTDITGRLYYPKEQKYFKYKLKFNLLKSEVVSSDDNFDNKFLSVGFVSCNDQYDHKHVKQSFKFLPYKIKDTNYFDQIYGFIYRDFDYRFYDYLDIECTGLILEKISLYNKSQHDHDISTYNIVSDEKLQHSYLNYQNLGNYEHHLLNIKASNINPYKCLGYHVKLTTKGRELFKDMYSNVIKYSLSYLNIQFINDISAVTSTAKFSQDEIGSSTIMGLRIPLTDLKNLEMWNNRKNRYINIRGILSDIRDVINKYLTDGTYSIIPDEQKTIFISNMSIDIMINGRMFSLINESTTNPIRINLEKDLPIMLTIEY